MDADFQQHQRRNQKSGQAANHVVWLGKNRRSSSRWKKDNTDDATDVATQNNHFSDKCPLF